MSFFEELKRRNVVKVGIAYLVSAWILVQVADILFENIGTPGWVMQTMLVFLGIGFFVAVFFAWAFELTPEGVKRESEVDRSLSITSQTGKKLNNTILVLMALAIAYLLFDKFSATDSAPTPAIEPDASVAQQGAEPAAEPAISRKSIAVLPFDNRSNREEDQFFTDGIHDDLLTTIARIGSMKVISRTSVMEYKNTTKKIPEIAIELGVAHILEGGIQRSGNQVRINVQLIDASSDEHLWAEIFDRELTAENLFAIQSEISTKIAEALQTTLSPEETRRINSMPTGNLAAYDAYLRGKQLMATRGVAELEEATRQFSRATELDPYFALAWVGLADSYSLSLSYGSVNEAEALAASYDAAQKALAIDPGLGEAYASLGSYHANLRQFDAMESAYEKAIELSPNYATAYHWYSNQIRTFLSRAQDAVDLARKAAELDPRSGIISSNLAASYANQGLVSLAEQQYLRTIELSPDFAHSYRSMANFYLFNAGRYDLAMKYLDLAIEKDPRSLINRAVKVHTHLDIGDIEGAERTRLKMEEIGRDDFRLGWIDMWISHAKGNVAGAREAWGWASARAPGSVPFFSESAAMLELINGDPSRARAIYLASDPNWLREEEWPRLADIYPGQACLVAYALKQTGDEALGTKLTTTALQAIDSLTTVIEDIDAWNPEFCYLQVGETEKAIRAVEAQVQHGHLIWMQRYQQLPFFEAIRFEPRIQAAMAKRQQMIDEQLKAIEAMNLEAGP